MKPIKFRRMVKDEYGVWRMPPPNIINGIDWQVWEIAFDERHLRLKLNGDMAEIIMPPKPFWYRFWKYLLSKFKN